VTVWYLAEGNATFAFAPGSQEKSEVNIITVAATQKLVTTGVTDTNHMSPPSALYLAQAQANDIVVFDHRVLHAVVDGPDFRQAYVGFVD
jgi:hypothetical protein